MDVNNKIMTFLVFHQNEIQGFPCQSGKIGKVGHQGARQKLPDGLFSLRIYPIPPSPHPFSGKSFCQKTLSGNRG